MSQSITTPAVFPPDHEITFRHPYFIALILATAPLGIDVKPGFRVTGGPLEADLLLIQRNYAPFSLKFRVLRSNTRPPYYVTL